MDDYLVDRLRLLESLKAKNKKIQEEELSVEDTIPRMSTPKSVPELNLELDKIKKETPMMSIGAPARVPASVEAEEANKIVESPNANKGNKGNKGKGEEKPKADLGENPDTSSKPKTREELIAEYNAGAEGHSASMKEARDSDRLTKLLGSLGQNLSDYTTAGMQMDSGVNLKPTKFNMPDFGSKADELEADRAGKLKDLLTMKKLQKSDGEYGDMNSYQIAKLKLDKLENDRKQNLYEQNILKKKEENRIKKADPYGVLKAQQLKAAAELQKDADKYQGSVDALQELDDVDAAMKQYGKEVMFGDGMGPFEGKIRSTLGFDATNKMKATFNLVALNQMIQKFAGMSKAIDSETDKAFFDSTQLSLDNTKETNAEILRKMRKFAIKMRDIRKQKKEWIAAKKDPTQFKSSYYDADQARNEKYKEDSDRKKEESKKDFSAFAGRSEGDEWEDDTTFYKIKNGKLLKGKK